MKISVPFGLCLLCLGLAHASGTDQNPSVVLEPDQVQKTQHQAPARALLGQLRATAAKGDSVEAATLLRGILEDPGADTATREWLLHEGLVALANAKPTSDLRGLVARISALQPKAFVWLEEGRHRSRVPLYDPGATARLLQRNWLARDTYDAVLGELTSNGVDALEKLAPALPERDQQARLRGAVSAFRAADESHLLPYAEILKDRLSEGHPYHSMAAVVALRLEDGELYRQVLRQADNRVALDLLAGVSSDLPADKALGWLQMATERSDVASSAWHRIAGLAGESQPARSMLLAGLGDPSQGASAAAAIAGLHDPGLALELGRLAIEAQDATLQRRALLALHLDNSPAARSELRSFAAVPDADPELLREVAKWLGQ